MIRRLFWVLLGAGLGSYLTRKANQAAAKLTARGIATGLATRVSGVAAQSVRPAQARVGRGPGTAEQFPVEPHRARWRPGRGGTVGR